MGPLLRHRLCRGNGPEAASRAERRCQRVFLGCAAAWCRRRTAAPRSPRSTRRSNAEISTRLSADSGYTELGELDAERAEHVAAAYRHDCLSAYSYFADVLESPPPDEAVGAGHRGCCRGRPDHHGGVPRVSTATGSSLAEHVELHELPDGGHYFVRTRPTQAAEAVLRAAEMFAYS